MKSTLRLICLCLLLLAVSGVVRAQTDVEDPDGTGASAAAAKQLGSRDPATRQRAAEELAAIGATNQRRLLEGYRLQEKNARVRLALDWALYRTGKSAALFELVRALDSSRAAQSRAYLSALERPEPLYLFLERANGVTQVELLRVLAKSATPARSTASSPTPNPTTPRSPRPRASPPTTYLSDSARRSLRTRPRAPGKSGLAKRHRRINHSGHREE